MESASALQIPYREDRDGFWGEQTSTLNWCEEDYNVTYYVAELVNTLTNLVFLWLGVKGLINVIQYKHSRVFIVVWLGYLLVGLGSMAFHATLKYEMQLADELPMIYTVCVMCFAAYSFQRSLKAQIVIGIGLLATAVWITVYYLNAKNPVFHQAAFGLLQLATTGRGFYVLEKKLKPTLKKRDPAGYDQQMKQMYTLAVAGTVLFSVGFVIWLLDNTFCHHLVSARNQVLLPWAVVLEGHGWWHILTGLGAYHMILWRVWLNRCLEGKDDFMLDWRPYRSIPQVVPKPKTTPGTTESKKIR
ncbi:ceramidase [Apodospora peruviana]|uniref:Ceramidase n=1 Tax=Apodospora peruviana TaxID=516989 RepID=A0AAE0ITW2_9PEZI|nr:ceramidase [Apodospora peruviana]